MVSTAGVAVVFAVACVLLFLFLPPFMAVAGVVWDRYISRIPISLADLFDRWYRYWVRWEDKHRD